MPGKGVSPWMRRSKNAPREETGKLTEWQFFSSADVASPNAGWTGCSVQECSEEDFIALTVQLAVGSQQQGHFFGLIPLL